MWTKFMDMYSGGGKKEKWEYIYIEASEVEAKIIFYNRFGHNPERVTCTCCGKDYSISEYETLEKAIKYDLEWGKITLDNYLYLESDNTLVIYETEIKPHERYGEIPKQGYIWM